MSVIQAKLERTVRDAADMLRGVFNKKIDQKKLLKRVHEWRGLPIKEQNRLSREKLDRLCIKWETIIKNPVSLRWERKHDLIFMHIPKAGGSTLDAIIAKNFNINNVVHINQPTLYRNPSALYKQGVFPRAALGHYTFNSFVYQCPPDPFVHITMLREPVSRVISYYNFLLAAPDHEKHKRAVNNSIDDFVENVGNLECHNGQAMRISGNMTRKFIKRPKPPEDVLDLAKENLERRFTLFGLTERYGEFLLMCRRLLGWRDLLLYSKKKVTEDTPDRVHRNDLSDATITRIQEFNSVDIEFYNWACDLTKQRCRELGITDEHVADFHHRNNTYHELLEKPFWDGGDY